MSGDNAGLGPTESFYSAGGSGSGAIDNPDNPLDICRPVPAPSITPVFSPEHLSYETISSSFVASADFTGLLTLCQWCTFVIKVNGGIVTGFPWGRNSSILSIVVNGPFNPGDVVSIILQGSGIDTAGNRQSFDTEKLWVFNILDLGNGSRTWDVDGVTGLTSPLNFCSVTNPGDRPGTGTTPITVAINPPTGSTNEPARPQYTDTVESNVDPDGVTRYNTLYVPPGTTTISKRPLVIFLHGGDGSADDVYDYTSLRTKAIDYNLSGDGGRLGFILASIQGRNLVYATSHPRDGAHHDFYYRDLASPSTNPDIKDLDRIIDAQVATGLVDTTQIYVMGWSNGGYFSQMYAIARHVTQTPGGNNVAAAAIYSAGDPFENISFPDGGPHIPSAKLTTYPVSTVPIYIIGRACDLVSCNEAQSINQMLAGAYREPGHVVSPWMWDLTYKVLNPNAVRLIITTVGTIGSSCSLTDYCTISIGILNHVRWPDGVADGSSNDYEPSMLDFLKDNKL